MHSPIFPGTFSSNYLMYICVDELQNIYFNMKDSEHFIKSNFSFLYLRQSKVLFFHLLLFAETLLCKLGIWGPLTWKILNILSNPIFLFFIWDNQRSCFFIYFCLLKHYSVSWGSGAHLGPQKLSHFKLSNMHFPTFPVTFSSKV